MTHMIEVEGELYELDLDEIRWQQNEAAYWAEHDCSWDWRDDMTPQPVPSWSDILADKDRRIAQLETLLLDARGLLDHYTSGRPDNWDGSTRSQAFATMRDIKKALHHERT